MRKQKNLGAGKPQAGRDKIYIVAYSGCEGSDYCAFCEKGAAVKEADAEFCNTIAVLKSQGYKITVACDEPLRKEFYVPDTGIYHEWEIAESTLE